MKTTQKGVLSLTIATAILLLGGLGYFWLAQRHQPANSQRPATTPSHSASQGTSQVSSLEAAPLEGLQRFTKSQLEEVTGLQLTVENVGIFREALGKAAVWQTLGYTNQEADLVAQRFATSQNQVAGVLREMATTSDEQLKVIIVADHVNIGTTDDLSQEAHPQPHEALKNYQEIEIEYELGLQEIAVNWEIEDGVIEATFENEMTGERLTGEKAQERLVKALANVDFQNQKKEEIFQLISQQLAVPTDAVTSFSYEVTWQDHQEKTGSLHF